MKKKQVLSKVIVAAAAAAAAVLFIGGVSLMSEKGVNISDISLDNVDALAAGEGVTKWYCLGSGSLDCPDGTKVKFIVDNYSLD